MRKDMAKVIVERPRRPGAAGRDPYRNADVNDLPAREGMRAPHRRGYGGKELNENLAPLRRFLASRVGKAWDRVYAEISAHLRIGSAVQQHVRDHLKDFVVPVRKSRGHYRVAAQPRMWTAQPWWQEFYVDRRGILRRTADRKPAKPARPGRR